MSWGGHSPSAPSRGSFPFSFRQVERLWDTQVTGHQCMRDTSQLKPSPLYLCPRKRANEDMCCGADGWAWWGPLQGQLVREDYPLDPEALGRAEAGRETPRLRGMGH